MRRRGRWALCVAAALGVLPASAEEYRLGAEDRLRIAVYEYPNLDGEYVVGASGKVALPLLGVLPAAGSTPEELATAIAGALTKAVQSTAAVSATVEVVEYRPFFILGDVEKPGPYAYRPGLRMLQAVALAGGVYRLADVGLLRVSRDVIAAQGEIRTLEARERALGFERVRLEAELRGGEAPEFAAAAGSRDAEAVERQRTVFAARREALDRQSATLDALIGSLRGELDALDRQGELKDRQVGTVEEELASTRELVGKGLAPKARGLELERLQADLESDRQEVATAKLRVRQAIARTEQSLFGLTDDRRAEVAAALEGVGRQLAETREALETQRGLLAEATAMAPQLRRLTGEEVLPLRYEVDRFGTDGARNLVAGEGDPVAPGDVVTVRVDDPVAAGERRAEAAR
jgi:protein involved in polysaccharide export with SLBB domain